MKILFVDDNTEYLEVLREYFECEGMVIHTAENGAEALELLKIAKFDLICSDVDMPVMNGIEFSKKIQEHKITTPFVFFTGGTRMTQQKAEELGAAAFFQKPQSLDTILNFFKQMRESLQTSLA